MLIHSKKSYLNVLAKTDSLKNAKITAGPQDKGRPCENDFHLQYLIEFLSPVILLLQTAPQPWPCCGVSAFKPSLPNLLSLRPTSFMVLLTRNASARACRVGTRQRPSGQQTHGRFTAAVLNYLHCQLAVPHVKIVTRAHSCQILMSPSNPLYAIHFISFHHICTVICFRLFSAVYPKVTTIPFQRKYIQNPYPVHEENKVPEGAVNLETVET